MDWKKWLGRIDRWSQSAWFWGGLILAAASGSLLMLGRATEIFLLWAPFSYGLAFWIAVPIVLWCLVPLKRLIPKRKDPMRELGVDAVRVFDAVSKALERMEMRAPPSPQATYAAISILGRMERAGLVLPSFPENCPPDQTLRISAHYLGIVGPLLTQGLPDEAKAMAKHIAVAQKKAT